MNSVVYMLRNKFVLLVYIASIVLNSVAIKRQLECADETVTIECRGDQVIWRFQSSAVQVQVPVSSHGTIDELFMERFSLQSNMDNEFSLVIHPALQTDSGFYTCVEDGGLGRQHVTELTVYPCPPFYENASNVIVEEGSSARLQCASDCRWLPPNWLHASHRAHPQSKLVDKGITINGFSVKFYASVLIGNSSLCTYSLVLKFSNLRDSGWYSCAEDGGNKGTQAFHLIVVESSSGQVECVGDDVTIECRIDRPFSVMWVFQSLLAKTQTLITSFGRVNESDVGRYSLHTNAAHKSYLVIHQSRLSDNGFYKCVENASSGREYVTKLTLNKCPIYYKNATRVYVDEGSTTRFWCRSNRGLLAPNWYVNTHQAGTPRQIANQGRIINGFNVTYNSGVLTDNVTYYIEVKSSQMNDTAWYTCIEDGGIGNKHAYRLIVTSRSTMPSVGNANARAPTAGRSTTPSVDKSIGLISPTRASPTGRSTTPSIRSSRISTTYQPTAEHSSPVRTEFAWGMLALPLIVVVGILSVTPGCCVPVCCHSGGSCRNREWPRTSSTQYLIDS